MRTYLVVGGQGRTGRRVVDQLRDRSLRTRVASRHVRHDPRPDVETFQADLAHLVEGDDVLAGVDGVAICVEPPYDARGADLVLHEGVARLAHAVARHAIPVVLLSQIYITRPQAYPEMAEVTEARGRGEEALRASGAPYTVIRPAWLHDGHFTGVRIEQGDTGDGRVTRDAVAAAVVGALLDPGAAGKTFEIFDGDMTPDWPQLFAALIPDHGGAHGH